LYYYIINFFGFKKKPSTQPTIQQNQEEKGEGETFKAGPSNNSPTYAPDSNREVKYTCTTTSSGGRKSRKSGKRRRTRRSRKGGRKSRRRRRH
jgi:hypothetical protein